METRTCGNFDPDGSLSGNFELKSDVTGEFANLEEFQVKNVSMAGFMLLSNYPPLIGDTHHVRIRYGGQPHSFALQVVHSRLTRIQSQPQGVLRAGLVYAVSCRILFESEFQEKLIAAIIQSECGLPAIVGSADRGFEMLAAR